MVTSDQDVHILEGLNEWDWQRDRAVVPEWLNAAKGTESYARVTQLVGEILQVESGMNRALSERWYISTGGQTHPPAVMDRLQELSRKHEYINEILARYKLTPALQRVVLPKTWMLSMSASAAPDEFVYTRVIHEENKKLAEGQVLVSWRDERKVGEADVVLRILNLAAASDLWRLRQCDGCAKWFYAERSHQRFCPGGECRVAEYSKSPKYKAYRKIYMRKHRAAEAAKNSGQEQPKRKGK